VEYEARLNGLLSKHDDPVVCNFDSSKFGASVAQDIMRTHPLVIIGGLLRENAFFVLIDAHGGRLWIEANEPRGAAFQFTVPSAASELRSILQSLHQTREPREDSVLDATHKTGAGV
jgi:hypothetical protein